MVEYLFSVRSLDFDIIFRLFNRKYFKKDNVL